MDALNAAADTSGLLPHLLEKDIWVVWSLQQLFAGPYAEHLVFKGGTSLSRAYSVIRRFSEDVASPTTSAPSQAIWSATRMRPCRPARARKRSGARRFARGDVIDYHAAVSGGLQLVPGDDALAKLAADYQHMVDDGLFLDDVEPFEDLLERCRAIQRKANATRLSE